MLESILANPFMILIALASLALIIYLLKSISMIIWIVAAFINLSAIGRFTGLFSFGQISIGMIVASIIVGILMDSVYCRGAIHKSLPRSIVAIIIGIILNVLIK